MSPPSHTPAPGWDEDEHHQSRVWTALGAQRTGFRFGKQHSQPTEARSRCCMRHRAHCRTQLWQWAPRWDGGSVHHQAELGIQQNMWDFADVWLFTYQSTTGELKGLKALYLFLETLTQFSQLPGCRSPPACIKACGFRQPH